MIVKKCLIIDARSSGVNQLNGEARQRPHIPIMFCTEQLTLVRKQSYFSTGADEYYEYIPDKFLITYHLGVNER